jgi:response regulator RpfG family c-di-GMP phosphodiesterase
MAGSDFRRATSPGYAIGRASPPASVLVVDDDPVASKLLSLMLQHAVSSCWTADDGTKALHAMERQAFDAVISDLHMPAMSGLELLVETRRRFPHMAFLVTTGAEDLDVAVRAMRLGADDYLVKPLLEEIVVASLDRALHRRRLEREVENNHRNLEKLVVERTEQLREALWRTERTYEETLQALGAAIDLRDGATAGHSWRVCRYSVEIAVAMNIPEKERRNIVRAASLHDIGKLGVPDRVLLKPGPLTDEEWVLMRQHAQLGFDLLKAIPFLEESSEIVLSHHERFDGSGYPRGLRGKQIPLGARVFSVADAFDAITSNRPYRPASTLEAARSLIGRAVDSQFDPQVVNIFLKAPLEQWQSIASDPRGLRSTTAELLAM